MAEGEQAMMEPRSNMPISIPIQAALNALRTLLYAHKTRHENGGTDEISVTGLSGLLADDQHVLDAEAKLVFDTIVTDSGQAVVDNGNVVYN